MVVAFAHVRFSRVGHPRTRGGGVDGGPPNLPPQVRAPGSCPRANPVHVLSPPASDSLARRPPLSFTSTPWRGSCTEARVTPDELEGSEMLSSPPADATGRAISSSRTARPGGDTTAQTRPPPFPPPPPL